MKKILLIVLIIGIAWGLYNRSGEISLGPGIMAPDLPRQEKLASPTSINLDEYTITKVADFRIKAKVLSKKNYHFGREADLSPTDLALGWGRMSDESILQEIKISQSGRFYRWRVDSFPIPRREIETHSANMHLIPANKYIESDIDDIRNGEVVEISGSLVNVVSDDGWRWKSSLTRDDTGNGACELIWVESLTIAR